MKPLEDAIRALSLHDTLCRGTSAEIADLLRSLVEAAQKPQWRPISEAPKDGTLILAWGAKRLEWCVTYWSERDKGWLIESCSETLNIYPPAFWMPLPPLPETREEKE